jgi:hypothetical protein
MRNSHRIFVLIAEGEKKHFEHLCIYNIKFDLREMGYGLA